MFAVINQNKVTDIFPRIGTNDQPVLFRNPCSFFPVERSGKPATIMQRICMEAFDLSRASKNNL